MEPYLMQVLESPYIITDCIYQNSLM